MHNFYPQMGHFYPQMGAGEGQQQYGQMGGMGRFYPQLGATVYSDAMGADFDVMQILRDAMNKSLGKLPKALQDSILASPIGQQAQVVVGEAAYKLGADKAAADAASFWTQREQQLTAQFSDLLTYTKSNYKKILTWAGIAVAGAAVLYFGYPVIRDMIAPKRVAANPRRKRRRKFRRSRRK